MAKPNPTFPELTPQDVARFWSKVDKSPGQGPRGDCWEWTGARFDVRGGEYGAFKAHGRMLRANRVALFLATGKDPEATLALHSCDNPPCCNPAHLSSGDALRNASECVERGRLKPPEGPKHWTNRRRDEVRRGDSHWTHRKPHLVHSGSPNPCARLSEEDVRQIRREYATGNVSLSFLARKYGVTTASISNVARRITWPDVPD